MQAGHAATAKAEVDQECDLQMCPSHEGGAGASAFEQREHEHNAADGEELHTPRALESQVELESLAYLGDRRGNGRASRSCGTLVAREGFTRHQLVRTLQ